MPHPPGGSGSRHGTWITSSEAAPERHRGGAPRCRMVATASFAARCQLPRCEAHPAHLHPVTSPVRLIKMSAYAGSAGDEAILLHLPTRHSLQVLEVFGCNRRDRQPAVP